MNRARTAQSDAFRRLPDAEHGRRRLRQLYVIAAAGLAALVPLILFAGFWIQSELNKSQRDVESYLSNQAHSLSRRIDLGVEQQLVALRAISALPALDLATPDFGDVAERLVSALPHCNAFSLIDALSGKPILSTLSGWPEARALELIGAVRDSKMPRVETFAREAGQQSVLIYVPVVRNDATQFVLVTDFTATDVQKVTMDESREAGLLMTVNDRGGRVLARSRSPDTVIGQMASQTLRDAAAGQSSGLLQTVSREGEPLSSAFSTSPLTGWTSVASMDRKQLEQFSTRSLGATIAAGVLSLMLAGILAVFIVHTVMERRVSDERLAASRALGELDARLLATTQEALGEQRKASSEREVLLREIYHRVKNNLQIVQSLLRLGSRDLSPEQREPFESAVRRVGAMARVHTLLYNSPDLASIDFKDYLDELLKELSEGFGAEERSIVSQLDAHSMRVPLDTAVPLAFIAVEILTNAYKHAFPEGRSGKISVEIRRDEPFGTLRIEDDGIGFTHERPAKRRLGLTIVRKLVQQIGGSIEEPAPGSSAFVVKFPISQDEGTRLPQPA
jgi:two-component sensor histidine kinase